MRVLVTSTPGAGHIHPIVPLAQAIQDAGHEVLWATAAESCPRIDRYGFRATPAGMATVERRALLMQRSPDLLSVPPRERRLVMMPGLFGWAAAPRMLSDLAAVCDEYRPDIIVHDLAEFAAAVIAAGRGLPHVTVAFSGALANAMYAALDESITALWAGAGLAAPDRAGLYEYLYLHPFPPAMGAPPSSDHVRPMRPLSFDRATLDDRPEWTTTLGVERPAVYVTFGTEVTIRASWEPILEAVATLDVDAIATIGPHWEPSELGPVPGNVRVEQYVPQAYLLDRVSAVVSHSGAGTLIAAVDRAVPQLCLPLGADQWDNADALTATGAGVTIELGRRDADTLHTTIRQLLDEPHFRSSAQRVAREIRTMPLPAEHVGAIEALANAG
jgi:UDP:flavonoid glycosyltransferase YjiC (YdhE family)